MAVARKSGVMPFVLAGVLALAALGAWLFAIESTSSAPAVCNNTYSMIAEIPRCRWPAVFVGLGWIAFTFAIASSWVGGVRTRRNRTSIRTSSSKGGGTPPHDAHPST